MADLFSIPEFEPREGYAFAVLPDGVYRCDEAAFRNRFVDSFPDSLTRGPICDGFFQLRKEARTLGISATQWIDGSFVESKLSPADVDIVTFVDYDTLNGLSPMVQDQAEFLLNGLESTKVAYHCHTFLVPSCQPGHTYYVEFENARRLWRKWWGATRRILGENGHEQQGYAKGFVEMILGVLALVPQISHERNSE